MKEQFIPYNLSLELKELGFDEDCFGYYRPIKNWMISTNLKFNSEPHFTGPNWCNDSMTFYFMYKSNPFGDRDGTVKNSSIKNEYIAAPLWQQPFDWFREKGFRFNIQSHRYTSVEFFMVELYDGKRTTELFGKSLSYEEAQLECLKKLIEIIKRNTKSVGEVMNNNK